MGRHVGSRILGTIDAEEIVIGQGSSSRRGRPGQEERPGGTRGVLGDHCYVGCGTRILVPEFRLGTAAPAFLRAALLQISRNCWIGGDTVPGLTGGLTIDDNVGIGSQSQIWTPHPLRGHRRGLPVLPGEAPCGSGKTLGSSGTAIVSPVSVGPRAWRWRLGRHS